jgi:hypothetical protein
MHLDSEIETNASDLCCKTDNRGSVLHAKSHQDLSTFSWQPILREMLEKQPFLLDVLLAAAVPTGHVGIPKRTRSLEPRMSFLYSVLMFTRWHELSQVQRVLATAMGNERTHQKVHI